MTQAALDDLVRLLDLEPIEVNIFRGVSPEAGQQRVFGGQVAGQALVAAGRTVPGDRRVHSLHAYFLRPGDPSVPILYEVDRIRDGRSFTTRRVVAIQHGRAIFNLSASFHRDEAGFDHQTPMPDVPPPESLPTFHERLEPYKDEIREWYERPRPIDMRFAVPKADPWERGPATFEPVQQVWMRADGELPDDPMLHACVVAYASDMTLLDVTTLPHDVGTPTEERVQMASLDHAMWFHRPVRADEWMLYSQESPAACGGRGFGWANIFTRSGTLVLSVAQEGLIRPLRR
jgi:acyl-CoA thioesterase-2